jgi:hypothetical protein
MGVEDEFERVRTALRAEEQAMAQEFERIDAEARATVDASVEHVRSELATQADRIREAIAQQRAELEAQGSRLGDEVAAGPGAPTDVSAGSDGDAPDDGADHAPTDDVVMVEQDDERVEHVSPAGDDAGPTVGDVERGD